MAGTDTGIRLRDLVIVTTLAVALGLIGRALAGDVGRWAGFLIPYAALGLVFALRGGRRRRAALDAERQRRREVDRPG